MYKVCMVGTGYVGLVTGACLADFGNRVVCVDVDARRIQMLTNGEIPFFEPLLDELVRNDEAWSRDGAPGDPWQRGRRLANGLYWQIDSWEGGEFSIGGTGIRPMMNSYRYGDAMALSRIAALAGKRALANHYRKPPDVLDGPTPPGVDDAAEDPIMLA